MARGLRTLLPDGLFHVTTRAVHNESAFRDDADRVRFLRLLAIAVRRHGWRVHGYCLMGTHYHLIVDATQLQLSNGMHYLNGVYAQAYNRRHDRSGHLFADRFASW